MSELKVVLITGFWTAKYILLIDIRCASGKFEMQVKVQVTIAEPHTPISYNYTHPKFVSVNILEVYEQPPKIRLSSMLKVLT